MRDVGPDRPGDRGREAGEFMTPKGIALDQKGNIYVTDHHLHRLQMFTNQGEFVQGWGNANPAESQFFFPSDVELDPFGNIYIADEGNYQVQQLNPAGDLLYAWGEEGHEPGQFSGSGNIFGLAIDPQGYVYVSDPTNQQVQKFFVTMR